MMISVVIPVLNEARTIGGCLSHLRTFNHHPDVIVVDGGSTDGTIEIVRSYPEVTVLNSPRGRGCQMNRGANAAQGGILFFLHADTRIPSGGLSAIEHLMTTGNGIAGGSFSLAFDDDSTVLRFFARFSRITIFSSPMAIKGSLSKKRCSGESAGFVTYPSWKMWTFSGGSAKRDGSSKSDKR